MEYQKRVKDFERIKLLSDSRRLAILRLLMKEPATLTQLGKELHEHPAHIRHHLKVLENAGFVELVEERIVSGFVEKFYSAAARAFILQEIVLPVYSGVETIVLMGSHDLALEMLAEEVFSKSKEPIKIIVLPVGSLDGLIALRQGLAQVASCHLLDVDTGEFNLPFIRHLLPDRDIVLVTLAHRQQGLIVKQGNPLGIESLKDLPDKNAIFVNRNPGSGTRLWLDRQLSAYAIDPLEIQGYENEVRTHTDVARIIAAGKADAGVGLQAVAIQQNLGFVPLFKERFDLVMAASFISSPVMTPVLEVLESRKFHEKIEKLGGYDSLQTGVQFSLDKNNKEFKV